jgi:hypothetical protein
MDSFRDRVINVVLSLVHRFVVLPQMFGAFDQALTGLGLRPLQTLELQRAPLLALSSWAIESPRDLPPNVFLTGLVLPQPAQPFQRLDFCGGCD